MNSTDFLKEYKSLRKKFPFINVVGFSNDNCNYGDDVFQSNNSYWVFECFKVDGCHYCEDHGGSATRDFDCTFGVNCSENCECLDYIDSSGCYYSQSFSRCYNLWYSWYCVDSHDCFGCANLYNKSYCVFNIQYTKEEYEEMLPDLKKMSKKEVLAKRAEIQKKIPQLHSEYFDTINSDYCDYAYYVSNCYYCFDCARDEDCGYLTASYDCKDTWDSSYVVRTEQSFECSHSGDIYNCYQVKDCDHCYNSYFLEDCDNCHDCFGCLKLSHKQYCILNVQYTKDEYFAKLSELRDQLGLHFSSK